MHLIALRRGVRDALMAAAEEHDRDGYEIVSPATIANVIYESGVIYLRDLDGCVWRVQVDSGTNEEQRRYGTTAAVADA